MKIVDVQVIPFRVPFKEWKPNSEFYDTNTVQTLTKIVTDEGAEGYCIGGKTHIDWYGLDCNQIREVESVIKPKIIGQNPFDREKFWNWLWLLSAILSENAISAVDMALWDLQGRVCNLPVHKLLGGCRDKVKAYASTYPDLGAPEVYAEHALECKALGYKHYKIHPYYFWDPVTKMPDPGRPSHIEQDIEACRLVRAAVGDEMVLSFDPWGTYRTYEEAYKVGKELEKLNFYWYEHPMFEYRMPAYKKLCQELTIPVLGPEVTFGSLYTRVDWIIGGASDMCRIDVMRGGITGAKKMTSICEAFGVKCELHMAGWGNLQILGATSEDTCEYYERGLLAPGFDYEESVQRPYLEEAPDPMDDEGYVKIPQEPGIGYKIKWDYIEDNKITIPEPQDHQISI